MREFTYKVNSVEHFDHHEKMVFLDLLKAQNRVVNPDLGRVNRCKYLAIALVNEQVVSIAAIKPKTASDFTQHKSNLPEYVDAFNWELGYCYTDPGFLGNGLSSTLVRKLIDCIGEENLMATTETRDCNRMIGILKKMDFHN